MTEDDVVRIVRAYIEGQFPRSCPTCGRRFGSLREYLENTTHLDSPVLYHETGDNHAHELGPMSLANCNTCGTTMTVGSRDIPRVQMAELMRWARRESAQHQISLQQVLHHVRELIDAQVLGEPTG